MIYNWIFTIGHTIGGNSAIINCLPFQSSSRYLVGPVLLNLFYLFDGVLRHFQEYFSYIVVVSFIGGGNRRTQKKPPTCHKSLTNLIT